MEIYNWFIKRYLNKYWNITNPLHDFSHITIDGKESNKIFKEWLESICDKLYDVKKKNTDNQIFEWIKYI